MLKEVNEILSKNESEVLRDTSLSQMLIKCYSKIYVNGSSVKGCEDSRRKYYRQLQINGIEMAKKMEKVIDRTCKPAFKSSIYSTVIYKHINPDYLDDQTAAMYLMNGILLESHFEILPESYLNSKRIVETKQEIKEIPVIEEKEVIKTLKNKKK
jgi:hypothetical protein